MVHLLIEISGTLHDALRHHGISTKRTLKDTVISLLVQGVDEFEKSGLPSLAPNRTWRRARP